MSSKKIPVYKERPGVSLLLGMGIIFIMVFFSLLVGNVVVSSIRQTSNVSRSNEAYYAAEGALEQGLLDNFNRESGYDSGSQPVDYNNTNLTANYQIQGTVPENRIYGQISAFAGMYGVPTPGTGNAGANCDPEKPVINQTFTYTTSDGYKYFDTTGTSYEDPADHPCNWNKIKTGETVTLPLYYVDENNIAHNLFGESTEEKLWIRLRTPCAYYTTSTVIPEYCTYSQRFLLQDNESQYPRLDPTLSWQIQAIDDTGQSIALQPFIEYDSFSQVKMFLPSTFPNIVTENLINAVRSYTPRFMVVKFNTVGLDLKNVKGCLWQFLGGTGTMSPPCAVSTIPGDWANRVISKPIMKISAIGNLINRSTGSIDIKQIPYLEYQILTSANLVGGAPVNTSQTITAEGVSGTFKQILQVNQPQAGGLPDYVVQQ